MKVVTFVSHFEIFSDTHPNISYGIVLSSKMCLIQEIASALIAGVIVVVVDWKRLLRRSKH